MKEILESIVVFLLISIPVSVLLLGILVVFGDDDLDDPDQLNRKDVE